jgi:hypothetical protein
MDDLKKLFERKIRWQNVKDSGVEFIAEVDNEKCILRMNDFPDEPLFTLIYKGNQIDFDNRPALWEIPFLK